MRKIVEDIVKQIREKYKPDRIILFGSCARGDYNENSDIDLIVVKDSELSFLKRTYELLCLLEYDLDLNLLVYTNKELDKMKRSENDFILTALNEGIELG